jgi:Na+/proline symporter
MFAASAVRRCSRGLDLFLVSNRSVGLTAGAMSVASTWIWAPALFIAAQKAFQQGLPGVMWFTAPNVGCLILFAFLAGRIRTIFPRGYTLPEYMAERYDRKTHTMYLVSFLSLQVCSLAVQLIAGAAMLRGLSGAPYCLSVLVLAVVFTSYSLIDGLHSSIRTDFLQLLLMLGGIAVLVPVAVVKGGGLPALSAGFSGFNGEYGNILDPWVAYSFGITVTIGLMSGPVGDQQHWQRAFAFAEGNATKGYILGALIFAVVPLSMSLLGFIAAGNPEAAPAVASGAVAAQQVGPQVIGHLIPGWGLALFVLMILAGLASTGDSALSAGGSIVAVDIYRRYVNNRASQDGMLRVSRMAIVLISLIAVGIALIPGITILSLFLFYGTLRSSTFVPTILTLYSDRIPSWGIFTGIALAISVGLPTYLFGELTGNVHAKVAANLGIVLISLAVPLFSLLITRRSNA